MTNTAKDLTTKLQDAIAQKATPPQFAQLHDENRPFDFGPDWKPLEAKWIPDEIKEKYRRTQRHER